MRQDKLTLPSALATWWRRQRQETSRLATSRQLAAIISEFMLGSLPSQRRQRYGDIEYDWEHRVNTSSATIDWRTRLLGLLNSPYQAIPPEEFHEIMEALALDFREFTFIDIGSGKGRALILASEYGFRQIIGIELLPELHRAARANIQKFDATRKVNVRLVRADATRFSFPADPTVVFLFNPLPASALQLLFKNIEESLRQNPRPLYVAYANPVLGHVIETCSWLTRVDGSAQYSIFRSLAGR